MFLTVEYEKTAGNTQKTVVVIEGLRGCDTLHELRNRCADSLKLKRCPGSIRFVLKNGDDDLITLEQAELHCGQTIQAYQRENSVYVMHNKEWIHDRSGAFLDVTRLIEKGDKNSIEISDVRAALSAFLVLPFESLLLRPIRSGTDEKKRGGLFAEPEVLNQDYTLQNITFEEEEVQKRQQQQRGEKRIWDTMMEILRGPPEKKEEEEKVERRVLVFDNNDKKKTAPKKKKDEQRWILIEMDFVTGYLRNVTLFATEKEAEAAKSGEKNTVFYLKPAKLGQPVQFYA